MKFAYMNNIEPEEIEAIARLVGPNVSVLRTIFGGNSKVFILKVNNTSLIAKKYMGETNRAKLSMEREIAALSFLRKKHMKLVPEIFDFCIQDSLVIMEFLQGRSPDANSKSMQEIIFFLQALKEIYKKDSSFPVSVEGIRKTSDLINQIEVRILQLELQGVASDLLKEVRISFDKLRLRTYMEIEWEPTYSVSDLGVHNMLEMGGVIRFLDFEFFGSDSPVKVIGDFLLHPRNIFSDAERVQFLTQSARIFKIPHSAIAEYLPLSSLKWALIVMRRLVPGSLITNLNSERESLGLATKFLSMSFCSGEELLEKTVYCRS